MSTAPGPDHNEVLEETPIMATRNGSTDKPTQLVKDRFAFYKRLTAIGAVFCPECYAYQFPSHTPCRVFDIGESLTQFGRALELIVYPAAVAA